MFADFAHFGFPRRVCCLKSKTFVVKDRPFPPGTRQNPTRHFDRIGSPLSQGRTSVASHATDPLMSRIDRISERAGVSNHISQILFREEVAAATWFQLSTETAFVQFAFNVSVFRWFSHLCPSKTQPSMMANPNHGCAEPDRTYS